MPSVTIDEDICTYVQRPFVKAFVRRLTPTAVTPNQVTLLRALLGVLSAALLATGVLLASNVAFKLVYHLDGDPGGTFDGANTLGLPCVRPVELDREVVRAARSGVDVEPVVDAPEALDVDDVRRP